MADIKDMYHLVRFIDSEKYNSPVGISEPHLAMNDCAKQYAAIKHGLLRRKTTERHTRSVISNAIAAGYVKVEGDNTPVHNGHKMVVCPGDGMQLISTEWWGRRIGLDEQTMKRYPETKAKYAMKYQARRTFIVGIVGAILGAAAVIVKSYLDKTSG